MTNQEAIEYIKERCFTSYPDTVDNSSKWDQAMLTAISALEKQIPKKLIAEGDGYADGLMVYDSFYCPSCDHCMEEDEVEDYCPNCGQKICWEEE